MMKTPVACVFLADTLFLVALAHGQVAALLNQACGPNETKFSVRTGPPPQLPFLQLKTQARIVVFPEFVSVQSMTGCWLSNRVGVDGRWVGAVCMGQSLSADIKPGKHHLCVDLQQKISVRSTALYKFTAEAEKTYFFLVRISGANARDSNVDVHIFPVNEEEGELLLAVRNSTLSKIKRR